MTNKRPISSAPCWDSGFSAAPQWGGREAYPLGVDDNTMPKVDLTELFLFAFVCCPSVACLFVAK
jgi:hypothetical protein